MIGLICLPVLYVVAAILGAFIPNNGALKQPGEVEIRLIRGPIHYDFMLPVNDTTKHHFAFLRQAGLSLDDDRAAWIIVGWGAETFYTTVASLSDLTVQTVGRGMFGDTGVLRFDLWPEVWPDDRITSLIIGPDQADRLYTAIASDVQDPRPIPDVTFTGIDRFFAAKGRFHLLRTCNVWLGDKLEQAGIAFGAWTPIPLSVSLSRIRFHGGSM